MKSSTAAVDDRAPLSQYLRAENEDGWTVFSSEEEKDVCEQAIKPERNPDLSVLKRIKNFLSDEATQEGSFFSSDANDGVQNYRVDYPFYDSSSEEDENVAELPQASDASAQDADDESIDRLEADSRQGATTKPRESKPREPASVEPKESTVYESKKTETPSVNESSLPSASFVLQTPETQTQETQTQETQTAETQASHASDVESSQRSRENETLTNASSEKKIEVSRDSLEASTEAKSEPQFDAPAEVQNAVEERETLVPVPCENPLEELNESSCAEERAEERFESSEAVLSPNVAALPDSQTFVVDFSETLEPVLKRRARGEEIEELPLVQTRAKRSRDAKRTSKANAVSASKTPDRRRVETPEDQIEEKSFSRLQRVTDARLAIFRRCVDLVSQRVRNTNDSAADKFELETLETPTPNCESDVSSVVVPWNDVFNYGESVEFVAAPCFYDLGSGASFATTTLSSPVR